MWLQGVGAFMVDEAALAALAPGLVLTQDACPTCDADADAVTAALQRAGLLGGGLRTPTCVLNLAPRTLADALETILEVRDQVSLWCWTGVVSETICAELAAHRAGGIGREYMRFTSNFHWWTCAARAGSAASATCTPGMSCAYLTMQHQDPDPALLSRWGMRRAWRRRRAAWWSGCGRGCAQSPPQCPRRTAARAFCPWRASHPSSSVSSLELLKSVPCSGRFASMAHVAEAPLSRCQGLLPLRHGAASEGRNRRQKQAFSDRRASAATCRRTVAAGCEGAGGRVRRVAAGG